MKMIGIRRPCADSSRCSSMPLRPGICKSVIRQVVSSWGDECRKSSADANVRASSPSDLTRLRSEERTDSSSSMIEMIGASDTLSSPGVQEERGDVVMTAARFHENNMPSARHEESYLGITLAGARQRPQV